MQLGKALMAALRTGRPLTKKLTGRIPNDPKPAKLAQHHLSRWRDEGRASLVIEALRLNVIPGTDRPPVGRGGYFRTWKTLAVAVARARQLRS